MELRQLRAFVAVATELHFGRAAERLVMAQPTLSELVSRLERELGAPLLMRTTRRVTLTAAGSELLGRATAILADVDEAAAAVRRVAGGTAGTLRVGMTPPVAPVLAPYLESAFAAAFPGVQVELQRLWLPTLMSSLADGTVDAALTCGVVPVPPGVESRLICAESLLVGLRPTHPLAGAREVSLPDLAGETLGRPRDSLFPAWALAQRQALAAAGVDPPTVVLEDSDLAAAHWQDQREVDWVLLVGSFLDRHAHTVVKGLRTGDLVPYTLLWSAHPSAVVRHFVATASTSIPPGWHPPPASRDTSEPKQAAALPPLP